MGVKNVLQSCAQTGGNTGYGACVTDIGFIRGILFVPRNLTFTTASMATLKTALQNALTADSPLNRLYPVHNLNNPTDNSEQTVLQTFADGSKAVVREGDYDWSFQWTDGAFCLNYALRKANGLNKSFFLYDDKGKLIGTDAGNDLMKGIVPNLQWTPPFVLNTGAAVTQYKTQVVFSPEQINENIAFVDFSGNNDGGLAYLRGLTGLQSVNLSAAVARASGVLNIAAVTSCGTFDMFTNYGTQLAVVSAWVATNKATGAVITITAVTQNANNKAFTITLDTTDPDYTATAGGILINLAAPSVLSGLNVPGFEGIPLAQ